MTKQESFNSLLPGACFYGLENAGECRFFNNVTDGLCFAVVPHLSEINRGKSFAPLSLPHVWDSGTHNKQ